MKLKRPIHRRLRAQRTSGAAFNGPKHLLLLLTDPPAAVHRASDCDVSPPVLRSGGNSGKKNRRLQFFSANESSAGHDSTLEPIQFFYRKRIFFSHPHHNIRRQGIRYAHCLQFRVKIRETASERATTKCGGPTVDRSVTGGIIRTTGPPHHFHLIQFHLKFRPSGCRSTARLAAVGDVSTHPEASADGYPKQTLHRTLRSNDAIPSSAAPVDASKRQTLKLNLRSPTGGT